MTFLLSMILVLSLATARPGPDLEIEARTIDAMLIAPCCFQQQVSLRQSAAAEEVRRDVRARLAAGQTRWQISVIRRWRIITLQGRDSSAAGSVTTACHNQRRPVRR